MYGVPDPFARSILLLDDDPDVGIAAQLLLQRRVARDGWLLIAPSRGTSRTGRLNNCMVYNDTIKSGAKLRRCATQSSRLMSAATNIGMWRSVQRL